MQNFKETVMALQWEKVMNKCIKFNPNYNLKEN